MLFSFLIMLLHGIKKARALAERPQVVRRVMVVVVVVAVAESVAVVVVVMVLVLVLAAAASQPSHKTKQRET